MMAEAKEKLGHHRLLVNNAGIQHVSAIEEFPVEKWDQIIAINLTSAFHTIRLAVPGIEAERLGAHHQTRPRRIPLVASP